MRRNAEKMNTEPTTAEIVKALRCDGKDPDCNGCMFENGCYVEDQMNVAADRLEQQEQRITEMEKTRIIQSPDAAVALANAIELSEAKERIVELERELAAAKSDLRHNDNCDICVGSLKAPDGCDCKCLGCSLDCRCKDCRDESKWEWRGAAAKSSSTRRTERDITAARIYGTLPASTS